MASHVTPLMLQPSALALIEPSARCLPTTPLTTMPDGRRANRGTSLNRDPESRLGARYAGWKIGFSGSAAKTSPNS